jgi:hypothetical protein
MKTPEIDELVVVRALLLVDVTNSPCRFPFRCHLCMQSYCGALGFVSRTSLMVYAACVTPVEMAKEY